MKAKVCLGCITFVLGLLAFMPSAWPGELPVVSADQRVKRYSASAGASLSDFIAHSNALNALCFSLGSAFGSDGNFYVGGSDNDYILRYNRKDGPFLDAFTESASGLAQRAGLLFFHDASLDVVSSWSPRSVLPYNVITGQFLGASFAAGAVGLSDREGLTIGPDGNLYWITDAGAVLSFDGTNGFPIGSDIFVATANAGVFLSAAGIAFAKEGNLYATNFESGGAVLRYSGSNCSLIGGLAASISGGLGLPRPVLRKAHREHRSEPVLPPVGPVRVAPEWLNDQTRVEEFTAGKVVRWSAAIVSGGVLWCLQSSLWASLLLPGLAIWRRVDLFVIVSRAPHEDQPDTQATPSPAD